MKATNDAWMCVAFLPIPHFESHPDFQGILAARVWHLCIDKIMSSLKSIANRGQFMADPAGRVRRCFTPLVGWVADLPEQLLIAAVAQNASPVTTASKKEFGDSFPHPPRSGTTTLSQIYQVSCSVDPWDLRNFQTAAKNENLSGVHLPFWRNWRFSDPAIFLVPEILHTCHKFFYDHILKWCKEVVGATELDARYMALHRRVGVWAFVEGICHVQQMTGQEHHKIQQSIVALIAGAAPPTFIRAVQAIIDFIYQAQCSHFTESSVMAMQDALSEFHEEKGAVVETEARRGKAGVIPHFNIPKLELFQSFPGAVHRSGILMQWSADVSE